MTEGWMALLEGCREEFGTRTELARRLTPVVDRIHEQERERQSGPEERVRRTTERVLTRLFRSTACMQTPEAHMLRLLESGLSGNDVVILLDRLWEHYATSCTDDGIEPQDPQYLVSFRATVEALCIVVEVRTEQDADRARARMTVPCLTTMIDVACAYRTESFETFSTGLILANGLLRLGCSRREMDVLFRELADGGLLILCQAISFGALTKTEVVALAQEHLAIRKAMHTATDAQNLLEGFSVLRGRVHPREFVRTIARVGIADAVALHACTDHIEVVRDAAERCRHYDIPIPQYILAAQTLRDTYGLSFERFVELTQFWTPATLHVVFPVYPDVALLKRLGRDRLHQEVVRAAEGGVPIELVRKGSPTLLKYVASFPRDARRGAAEAFHYCGGDTTAVQRFRALPPRLRAHPVVHRVLERHGPAMLDDVRVLERCVACGAEDDADVRCIQLLSEHVPHLKSTKWPAVVRLFSAIAAWESDHELAFAYTLSLAQRSVRMIERGIRDRAYLTYRLLRHPLPTPISHKAESEAFLDREIVVPRRETSARDAGQLHDRTDDAQEHRTHHADLRASHLELNLIDVVPDGVDADVASALIVYGFADLGRHRVYASGNAIPTEHARGNCARRFKDARDWEVDAAWQWLTRIGIIYEPNTRGVVALNLDHHTQGSTAAAVAHRASTFFRVFRMGRR